MKTPYNLTERFGHIDLFFIGSCRVSLLPTPPESGLDLAPHTCSSDCDHDHEEEELEESEELIEETSEVDTPQAEPTYTYKKLFVRQGLRTHTIEIPTELSITAQDFLNVFTTPHDDIPQFIAAGTPEEQWLVEMREEYLGSIDPISNSDG